jgi:hypothetical protein
MVRFDHGWAAILLSAASLAACSGTENWDSRLLETGEPLPRIVQSDTGIVLVYDPADCFTCYGSLQPWLELSRRQPSTVALVFTRSPSSAERRQLATYRISARGTLAPLHRPFGGRPKTPQELLIVHGEIRSSHVIDRRTLVSPLLQRVNAAVAAPLGVNQSIQREHP